MEELKTTTSLIDQIKEESSRFQGLPLEIGKAIVGQQEIINFIVIAILTNGHILLEGVPGIAKTTMIKAVNKSLGLDFNRIQFTPDLLPADLIGTLIFNQKTVEFETKKGPIFANLILADEINRAPAKVQAALLEAMQEQQVTIGSQSFKLDKPFLVFATQNPLEQEGTYRLPEAQIDRFMFKLLVNYPTPQEEKEIIKKTGSIETLSQVISKKDLFKAQQLVNEIYVDEKVADYIISLVFSTRTPEAYNLKNIKEYLLYGASPRATLALYHTAKAHAFLKKRHFITPDDVKTVALPILRHRIGLTYEAEAEEITPDHIIHKILATVPSP